VHDVTQNTLIVDFLSSYKNKQRTFTLQELKDVDVTEYNRKIDERFQNPNVRDTLTRLGVDGSNRIYKLVIPIIADRLKQNERV
jgi:mannitol 2-dehydrogenase